MKHIKIIYCGTGGAERVHIRPDGIYARNNSCLNIEFNNKHLQIDCPPDLPDSFLKCNLRLSEIDYLLITHSHKDHCYPFDIINAKIGNYEYPVEFKEIKLEIYANEDVGGIIFNTIIENKYEYVERYEGFSINKCDIEKIRVHKIKSGRKEYLFEGVEILPIRTDHQDGNAFGYILKFNNINMIYISDFGSITEEMHDIILDFGKKHKFDIIVFGCPVPYPDVTEPLHSHAELKVILEYYNKLLERGLLKNNCSLHLIHLSPRWVNPSIMEKAMNDIKESGLENKVILTNDGDKFQIWSN